MSNQTTTGHVESNACGVHVRRHSLLSNGAGMMKQELFALKSKECERCHQ
jgi:hypothetical protein